MRRVLIPLFLATTNPGKARELRELLSSLPVPILTPEELNIALEYQEESDDLMENAKGKALQAWEKTKLPSLGEDTALEVDALGGLPGVRAKRFFGEALTDEQRWRRLLEHLEGVPMPRRTARFRTAVVVAFSESDLVVAQGILEGFIATAPRGKQGFGYDPVFFVPEVGKTLAELTTEEKNAISHRARAVRKLLPALKGRLLGRD